jgi:hypothetical protein
VRNNLWESCFRRKSFVISVQTFAILVSDAQSRWHCRGAKVAVSTTIHASASIVNATNARPTSMACSCCDYESWTGQMAACSAPFRIEIHHWHSAGRLSISIGSRSWPRCVGRARTAGIAYGWTEFRGGNHMSVIQRRRAPLASAAQNGRRVAILEP